MMEWVRFAFAALFLTLGVSVFVIGIFGVYRFRFVLNRMHAAALLDTGGLLFVVLSVVIADGWSAVNGKLLLIVAFLWLTSPIASHLISKMELFTDEKIGSEIKDTLSDSKGSDEDDLSHDL